MAPIEVSIPRSSPEVILGLVFLIFLGYLASYHFRSILHRWKGLDAFLTSGFLYIFIGVLFGPLFLNVLSPQIIRQLDPAIYLALGWIGFIVGIQFEWRLLKHLPRRFIVLAQLESVLSSMLLFGGLFWVLKRWSFSVALGPFDIWTHTIILTACGVVSSSLTLHYHARQLSSETKKALRPLEFLVSLHVFVPLLGLAALFSFFHVDQVHGAHLSGWIWLVIHGITGVLLGVLMFYLLKPRLSENERLALIFGGITFSAGIAAYLHISPVVVCFVAGIVFANMPGFNNVIMQVVLGQAERPLYLMMLILAGSLWRVESLTVWGFLVVYILVRFIAKGFALWVVSGAEPSLRLRFPLLGGMLAQGPLAIALVVGYEQRYGGPFLTYVVTAILAGAIVNELLAGRLLRLVFPKTERG